MLSSQVTSHQPSEERSDYVTFENCFVLLDTSSVNDSEGPLVNDRCACCQKLRENTLTGVDRNGTYYCSLDCSERVLVQEVLEANAYFNSSEVDVNITDDESSVILESGMAVFSTGYCNSAFQIDDELLERGAPIEEQYNFWKETFNPNDTESTIG